MRMVEQLAQEAIRSLDGSAPGHGSDEPSWRVIGPLGGGAQSGAWLVADPDGGRAVLKVATTRDWSVQVVRAAPAVRSVRDRGYPTPEWRAVGVTDAGLAFQVQEPVRGSTVDVVDLAAARALIALIERQAGLDPDPDRNWNDFVAERLGPGLSDLAGAAAAAGDDGRMLLDLCTAMAADAVPGSWPRTDMVHGDLRPANVLFDDGRVSGVVDIEAIGSGTRAVDYATLLSHEAIEDAAVELIVDAGARAAGAEVIRACVALVLLDLVGFVARRNGDTASLVADLLRRAELIDALTRPR